MITIVVSNLISILVTWLIADYFYEKSKNEYDLEISKLIKEIQKLDINNKLVLEEERINKAVTDYLKKGTPKYMIDTFTDLTNQQKAEMYDKVLLRAKGRKGNNNPYQGTK